MAGYIGNTAAFLSSTSGADIDGTVTADGLTVDTTTLVVDSTNNRVGIGTSSPTSTASAGPTLEISGTAGGNLVLSDSNATTGQRAKYFLSQGGTLYIGHSADNGTSPVNDLVVDSSGNVGIGITSMVNPLHVGVTSNTASKTSGSAFDGGALRLDGALGSANSEVGILAGANDGLSSGIGFSRANGSDWGTQIKFYTHSPSITTTDELTEVMRIDSSGNLLVGKTAASSTTVGAELRATGQAILVADGTNPILMNRQTSDGDIAVFRKDGTTVGSIGTAGGDLYVGNGTRSLMWTGTSVFPRSGTGGISDATVDLGNGSNRFKDLYLSNSVSLSNATTSAFAQVSSNILQLGTSTGDPFVFYTNNAERMRIDSSGNVGIGTTSVPSEARAMVSGGRFYVNSQDQYSVLLQNSGTSGGFIGTTAANTINFFNPSGTERMRIDSSGNVGIGTNSPSSQLSLSEETSNTTTRSDQLRIEAKSSGTTGVGFGTNIYFVGERNGGTLQAMGRIGYEASTNTSTNLSSDFIVETAASGTSAERMRINSGGTVNIGTTAASGASGNTGIGMTQIGRTISNCDTDWNYEIYGAQTGRLRFFSSAGGGTQVGSVTVSTSSTSYNTSSDHRLKENVTDVTDGITRVKQLEPKRFNFIADPDTTVDGFLAHEAQAVVPEAVTGTHNEVDDDGNAVMQGIDQSKLVPLLTAALKEAITKIETLETEMTSVKARLDALEGS